VVPKTFVSGRVISLPTPSKESTGYSLRQVADLLGLPAARVRSLAAAAGLAAPFDFAAVAALRSLAGVAASPRRLKGALARFHGRLAGLRVSAEGGEVVVRDGAGLFDARTGQGRLDFAAPPAGGEIVELRRKAPPPPPVPVHDDADDSFAEAQALEDEDPAAALQLYEQALAARPDFYDARVNAGRLLHDAGEHARAEAHYRAAAALVPDAALPHFNLGVLLEDCQREAEAAEEYRLTLARDDRFADAHFNLGRLLEKSGDRLGALRHLSRYRQLSR
jgi:tetratricopeptide (TPR) repeat protein